MHVLLMTSYLNPQIAPQTMSTAGTASRLAIATMKERNVLFGKPRRTVLAINAGRRDTLPRCVDQVKTRLIPSHRSSRMRSSVCQLCVSILTWRSYWQNTYSHKGHKWCYSDLNQVKLAASFT